MPPQRWKDLLVCKSYDINDFVDIVEQKDECEIILLANQEATAAWRALCQQKKEATNELDQYQHALEELIWFIRTPVTYRPFRITQTAFDRFLELRHKDWA